MRIYINSRNLIDFFFKLLIWHNTFENEPQINKIIESNFECCSNKKIKCTKNWNGNVLSKMLFADFTIFEYIILKRSFFFFQFDSMLNSLSSHAQINEKNLDLFEIKLDRSSKIKWSNLSLISVWKSWKNTNPYDLMHILLEKCDLKAKNCSEMWKYQTEA